MRQLVSHLSGIRHYSKKPVVLPKTNNEPNGTAEEKVSQEFNKEEYHIRDYYNHVRDSLLLFQDDELFFKPGIIAHFTQPNFKQIYLCIMYNFQ